MKRYSNEFKDEDLKLSNKIGVKKASAQPGIEYYTIAIEFFNLQMRKVTKSRTVFSNDDCFLKIKSFAVPDITRKWTGC